MDAKLKTEGIQESYDSFLSSDWDLVPYHSSTLELFHANTRLQEKQRDLILKRIDLQRSRVYNYQDWQEVQTQKTELRRQFLATDKTVGDKKASKNKFNRKNDEHRNAQASVQEEINRTQSEIEKDSKTKEEMEKYVSMYSELFTSYLETVAQKCPEFNSIQDILNRYETLENCRYECAQLLKKEMEEALELKREMSKLVEEKSSRLKALDNSLVMLQVRRKKAADVRKKRNQMVVHIDDDIANRLEESVTLQQGIYDLYREMCNKRKMKPNITKEDTKNQMQYIEKTILFYKDVIHLSSALQQSRKEEVKNESSICKSNFVKKMLNNIMRQSIENIKRH